MRLLLGSAHKRWKAVMYTSVILLIAYAAGFGPPTEIGMAIIGMVSAYVAGQSATDWRESQS